MTAPHITSVYGSAEAEYVIKKSRFITHVKEVRREDEAAAYVEELKKKYWDANHTCYAWQIGLGGKVQKSNDAGEPAGTAGKPILETLKKRRLTNTVAVVTRYFGGVKLGASGLIRAYGHSVVVALDAADIADYLPYTVLIYEFGYPYISTIERLMESYAGTITDRSFGADVTFTMQVPEEKAIAFKEALTNSTNGRARLLDEGSKILPIIRPKEAAPVTD